MKPLRPWVRDVLIGGRHWPGDACADRGERHAHVSHSSLPKCFPYVE